MEALDFDALRKACMPNSDIIDCFAYWLGVLSDKDHWLAHKPNEGPEIMSTHMEAEEQAFSIEDLGTYSEIIPDVLMPVAPVTLALKWAPFRAAIVGMGQPQSLHGVERGRPVAVFCPTESVSFSANTPDEKHFLYLLRECNNRALRKNGFVFICGSPGWIYEDEFLGPDRYQRRLLKKFGYSYTARMPPQSWWTRFRERGSHG